MPGVTAGTDGIVTAEGVADGDGDGEAVAGVDEGAGGGEDGGAGEGDGEAAGAGRAGFWPGGSARPAAGVTATSTPARTALVPRRPRRRGLTLDSGS